MKKHYNLYYIFLEDKLRNAMPAFRAEEIRRAVVRAYEALKGLGIKFLIATLVGCFAVVGILGWDVLRCVGPLSRLCWKLIKAIFKGLAAVVACVVRMIRGRKVAPVC